MSKGNLFLGLATGKIGSVVLYRAFGEERARSWVAHKRNPRTWRQALQRCLIKTAQQAYSSMLSVCRESFQGLAPGTPCQAAFVSRNLRLLRSRVESAVDEGRAGVLECPVGNYNGIGDNLALLNPLMVSDGGLSSIGAQWAGGELKIERAGVPLPSESYADVCAWLGVSRGTRLDIIMLSEDTAARSRVRGVDLCRVVLEPHNGDYGAPLWDGDGHIFSPNAGNIGHPNMRVERDAIIISSPVLGGVAAGAVIQSRMFGDLRQYSPEYLSLAERNDYPLGLAVASYLGSGGRQGDVYIDGG